MSDSSPTPSKHDSERGAQRTKKTPQKVKPTWFRVLFSVAFVGVVLGIYTVIFNGDMVDVIKGQLSKLREDRITQAYYDYTSKGFQETTSLEEFREFLSFYKVLSDNKSFTYMGRTMNDGVGIVEGILVSNQLHEMNAEYLLVKEDNDWKIQSIRLKEAIRTDETEAVTQELTNKVHDQLKALRRDEVLDAYYDYLSQDFKKETPFQVFREYVENNSILTSFKNVEFKQSRIDGVTGFVELVLSSDAGDFTLEYKLRRENDDWKVWSLRLILSPEEAAKKLATDPEALVGPVRELLNSLLLDDIEKAYHNTSKEFQQVTSLSSFEDFVHTYPALSRRDLTDIKTGMIEDGAGKLRVNLHDEEGMTVMEFKLGFDEGQWRVWGVKVIESPEREDIAPEMEETKKLDKQSLAEQLIEVIRGQLHTLMHQDNVTAYYTYTSQEFQDTHSLSDFENLIAMKPVFAESRDSYFEKMIQNGNKITLKGTIKTLDYKTYPVSFEMVKEYGNWKINHFDMEEEENPVAETEKKVQKDESPEILIKESEDIDVLYTDIKKINVGDQVDENGIIKTPRVVIDSDTNLLFINVNIEDGIADSLVTVFLNHIDSASTAPPLSTKLKKDGNTIVSFSYAAPSKGWPPGNYLIKVTTDTGDEHIQGFQLREGEREFY